LPQARETTGKRNLVARMAQEELGLELLPGSTTFYMFVGIGRYRGSSHDLAVELIRDHNIAVVPGSAYGRSTERYVRVSVGTESVERIRHALTVLKQATEA
jgi:aspartate/methionine/tyrosine aminotransferase